MHAAILAAVCTLHADVRAPWMDTTLTPMQRAVTLAANMTAEDIVQLTHGSGGGYIGNVPAMAKFGIPALNMNDGPQGFRDNARPGTTTALPSGLTMAAAWSSDVATLWGTTMGTEFYQKGANVQLGPGVCVARVPKNGRNFEYLSGEDAFLGYTLVQPTIRAIQSQGVVANVKHYVNNNQETNRQTINEVVDERTRFELYYPPFEGAIEADVGSFMCSYNKINGAWSCENEDTLTDLKTALGFKGWVMSDWGATHSQSLNTGLDQEMPGGKYLDATLLADYKAGKVTLAALQDTAARILYPLFLVGAMDTPNPNSINNNVTSVAHNTAARNISARSTVLLKNTGILPLPLTAKTSTPKYIAIIGDQAKTPIVHGTGSGQVVPYYTSAPFDAVKKVLEIEEECSEKYNYCVVYDDGKNITAAAMLAGKSDIAMVFAATVSGEGSDRKSLSLDGSADLLIATVAGAQHNTIVSAVTPGALLTPWRDAVAAILIPFLPGQEYGNAIASIIFGTTSPEGRLPLTFPNKENEVEFTPEQYPGVDLVATYSERLLVGYKWYNANNVVPAYAFGHGLTYTTFDYSALSVSNHDVSFSLRNSGSRAGVETPQLYLGLPGYTESPPKQLKGFDKVRLGVGEMGAVTFSLTDRDLSFYNVSHHGWEKVSGTVNLYIGSSVEDIKLTGTMVV